jgi:hypothetical protein
MAKEVNFTEEDWLNELTQFYPVQVARKPGGITQQEAAKLWKIDTRTACARLNAMVDEGAPIQMLAWSTARICKVTSAMP